MKRIYLDCNASMPMLTEVREYLSRVGGVGNPASIHEEGRRARHLMDRARANVAAWASVSPDEVIFTSGGTEANATAVHMLTHRVEDEGRERRVAVSAGSHASIRESVESLAGWKIEWFGDPSRPVPPPGVSAIFEIAANNETGLIADLASALEVSARSKAYLHVDAVQLPGKLPFDDRLLQTTCFSLSGHKIGGPMGAGVLVMPCGRCGNGSVSEWRPLIRGGGQEAGRRSGTPSLLPIIGLGEAIAKEYDREHCRSLAVRLRDGLQSLLGGSITELSRCDVGLPGTLLVAFKDAAGDVMNAALDVSGVAASYGSACGSGEQKPSRALTGLGFDARIARCAVRFSIGPYLTASDVDSAAERIAGTYRNVIETLSVETLGA